MTDDVKKFERIVVDFARGDDTWFMLAVSDPATYAPHMPRLTRDGAVARCGLGRIVDAGFTEIPPGAATVIWNW